jgi:hypothetical protein
MSSLRQYLRLLFVATAFIGGAASADDRDVAAVFSKAAMYAFSQDFNHSPVTKYFSAEELRILEEQRSFLEPMVEQALLSESVGGALLTAHFKLTSNLPQLRWRLFQPGRTYGWEGPDYRSGEAYLTDAQYVYHSVYVRAIEETTGAPIYKVVMPTQEETEMLIRFLGDRQSEHYYWAKWLSRKLRLALTQ